MAIPKFSNQTLEFLKKASRQKRPDYLERNRADYEKVLLAPLQHLAAHLKKEVGPLAPSYHFPLKGIGRLKRPAPRVQESGGPVYKNWISYSAARPRESRFSHNPNLYFMIEPDDREGILVAGGLYMPSSQQLKAIRETIAVDASAFDRLFATKDFARCFPGGFSDEKKATRPPRGFDPNHPRMDWLKLQAYFVWRPYSKREFTSAGFPELVARDWKAIVKLNELLEKALAGRLAKTAPEKARASQLDERIRDIGPARREMDF